MFSPYHRFTNCNKLENIIEGLSKLGNVSDDVNKGYKRYHFALVHKMKCARNHLDSMIGLMSDTQAADALKQTSDFLFRVNMYLDGFFYTCGSAMDILAREVLTYFAILLPNRVYFETAKQKLSSTRPTDTLLNRLDDPSWRDEFSLYRNTLTHELIIAGNFNISVTMDGDTEDKTLVLALPDDPRVDVMDRTFKNNPDVLAYCKLHIKRLLKLINIIYGEIATRATVNSSFPL